MLESYTTLAFLAAVTQRARLGTLVTGVSYRHPGHLVKIVSTLDVLSGGRAYFGIGAGWYEREARALDLPFQSTQNRFERLEETLQIAKQMWSGKVAPYDGKHYHLAETLNSPQPLTKPHPPILIGGSGEKKTLRLVAQYADACNFYAQMGSDALSAKLDILRRHCEHVGRDYAEIERTALAHITFGNGGMSASDLIAMARDVSSVGIQHLIVSLTNVSEIRPLEIIGRAVIPAVAEL
jgi:F420-dependent oxidoreductase-like protein